MTFDPKKPPFHTRDGREARLFYDERGEPFIWNGHYCGVIEGQSWTSWRADGRYDDFGLHKNDLLNVTPEPEFVVTDEMLRAYDSAPGSDPNLAKNYEGLRDARIRALAPLIVAEKAKPQRLELWRFLDGFWQTDEFKRLPCERGRLCELLADYIERKLIEERGE